jgi:phospholipid/cholesterol/gamma-HCH transport system substrate-binding protein
MATRAQKVRLALFFILSIAVLALFLATILGTQLLGKRDLYTIEFTGMPVSGLNKGAAVKYLGFNVGRIEDIRISPTDVSTVVVEISIERRSAENAIRVDTEARMASLGITGLKYIELFGGSNDAAPLPTGSRIRASDTFFSNLQERAEVLTVKVEQSIDNLNKLLNEENQRVFTRLLSNAGDLINTTNELVQGNRATLDSTLYQVQRTSQHLASTTQKVDATVDSLHLILTGQRLQRSIDDFGSTMSSMREQMDGPLPLLIARMDTAVQNIDRTFVGIDQTMGASRQNLLRAMQDLEETLQNVRETTELIRENPAILIRGGGRSSGTE